MEYLFVYRYLRVCGVVVSRSLRMGEARGSIPRTSNIFYPGILVSSFLIF